MTGDPEPRDDQPQKPAPWEPGHQGKFLIDIKAVLHAWRVDGDGLPPHEDVRVQLDIESLMEGEIHPSGVCWATHRDASAGPDMVARVFASPQAHGLTYGGRREQHPEPEGQRPRWGRDPARIAMILGGIEREWRRDTDSRLGQLIVNLVRMNTNVAREEEGRVLFNVPDGDLLRWLGPQTEDEETYIREEPRRAREGWRAWEKEWRESDAYKDWLRSTQTRRPGEQDDS
jgi:hypothetical protein